MASSSNPSTTAGSAMMVVTLPFPWPPLTPKLIHESTLVDGFARVLANPNGTLRAELQRREEIIAVDSCVLVMNLPIPEALLINWEYPKLVMYFSRHIVASNTNEKPICGPLIVTPRLPIYRVDHSEASAHAIVKRRGKFMGTHSKPGRRAAGEDYLFGTLRDERAQIVELLALINNGATYHARGLAARLRLLIAGGRKLGLLQQCAAALDEPLTLYVGPQTKVNSDRYPEVENAIILASASSPDAIANNAIDIDVWLKLPALWIRPKGYTNEEILADIGNTIGAHADSDVEPTVDMLRSNASGLSTGVPTDLLINYLCHVGRIAVALCDYVIERKELRQ
jgi:hypothetical protein